MTKREREITDINKIEEILTSCSYLHLGLVDDGMPYVVPLNYGVTKDEKDGHYIIYLHGANTGRKLDVIRKNPHCCFTMERNVAPFEGRMASIVSVMRIDVRNLPAKHRPLPGQE